MQFLAKISITTKLVIMQLFITIVVIIVCSLVFLISEYYSLRFNKEKSLTSITHVIGQNLVAPILFEDKETAYEILNDLRVQKDVLNASILTIDKKKFSTYKKEDSEDYNFNIENFETGKTHYIDDQLLISYPIKSESDLIGTLLIRADVSDIIKQLYKRSKLAIFVILFGALLSFLLVIGLQMYITKPINNLVQIMSQIMLQKNYSLRSKINSGDEIGKMSNVFNELLDDVEHYSTKLEDTNNQLEHRVEARTQELKMKNEKLIIAKEKEEESNKIKEQFMASISHEIRTPLNAIIGFQELLKDTPLNEEQKDFLNSIDFAGKNLLVLINDILDMSKIDAGKFVFNETELNIRETIHSVIELMEYRAVEKGIILEYEIDEKIPNNVTGDESRLSQVMINLIGNAVKFTEKGFVSVKVKYLSETEETITCEFIIKDTGIGIPKDKLEMIFDRFTQVSSDTTKKYGGTGLGLSIVKQIVELQGGKIYVESEVGIGSNFHFEFTFNKEIKSVLRSAKKTLIKKVSPILENKKLHGLLAEDIVLNQKLLKKIMEKWGYDLDVVSNGKEALKLVEMNNYDFILMDLQMPIMDGKTATKNIRNLENPIKKSIPIIALTAMTTLTEVEDCMDLGMNAFLQKPFDFQKLKEKIHELVFNQVISESLPEKNIQNGDVTYDLSHLIEHASGDTGFLKEIYQEFIIEMPEKIMELRNHIKEKDNKAIHKLFHGFKGIFPTFGMYGISNLLDEILNNIDNEIEDEKLQIQINKLESIINHTIKDLEIEIERMENKGKAN